jgi:hypothetical protein
MFAPSVFRSASLAKLSGSDKRGFLKRSTCLNREIDTDANDAETVGVYTQDSR